MEHKISRPNYERFALTVKKSKNQKGYDIHG
jgi:hypothetical protein